jgi:ethanolamine utilization protein EutQ (cupin superfamily)
VVSGELTLNVFDEANPYQVTGGPGDVLTIARGATVEYAGISGTRLFVTFAPLNWQDLIDTVQS